MVLNLLRVEEINPEYMLERSFYQFQNYAAIPGLCESKQKPFCIKFYFFFFLHNQQVNDIRLPFPLKNWLYFVVK